MLSGVFTRLQGIFYGLYGGGVGVAFTFGALDGDGADVCVEAIVAGTDIGWLGAIA